MGRGVAVTFARGSRRRCESCGEGEGRVRGRQVAAASGGVGLGDTSAAGV